MADSLLGIIATASIIGGTSKLVRLWWQDFTTRR